MYALLHDGYVEIMVDADFPDAGKNSAFLDKLTQSGNHLLVKVGNQVTFLPAVGKPSPEKIVIEWLL
jgi:hypothetical protein